MPEDSALPELLPVPLRALRNTTIDLARRLNEIIGQLVDTHGYAELRVEVAKGVLRLLHVKRSFRVDSADDVQRRLKELFALLEENNGYAEMRIKVERGVPRGLWIERSFRIES